MCEKSGASEFSQGQAAAALAAAMHLLLLHHTHIVRANWAARPAGVNKLRHRFQVHTRTPLASGPHWLLAAAAAALRNWAASGRLTAPRKAKVSCPGGRPHLEAGWPVKGEAAAAAAFSRLRASGRARWNARPSRVAPATRALIYATGPQTRRVPLRI